jgi:hypothetical protein
VKPTSTTYPPHHRARRKLAYEGGHEERGHGRGWREHTGFKENLSPRDLLVTGRQKARETVLIQKRNFFIRREIVLTLLLYINGAIHQPRRLP